MIRIGNMFCFHKRTPRPPVAAQLRVVFSPHSTVVFNIPLSAGVVLHLHFSCTNVRRARRSRLNFVLSFPLTQRLCSTSHCLQVWFYTCVFLARTYAAPAGRGSTSCCLFPPLNGCVQHPQVAGVVLRLRFSCTKRRYYNRPRPAGAAYWLVSPGRDRRARLTGLYPRAATGGRGLLACTPWPRPAGAAYWLVSPGRDRRARLTLPFQLDDVFDAVFDLFFIEVWSHWQTQHRISQLITDWQVSLC